MLVYVTSIYSVRDDYLATLYQNFQQILKHISVPIYVFTDRVLPFSIPSNCTVILQRLDEFQTYQHCLQAFARGRARLPAKRNVQKDTAEFMALMNTKMEMIWLAVPYFKGDVTHVAWIDAGIAKILTADRIPSMLAKHQQVGWPRHSVTIPGCWSSPSPPSSDAICWRFCGGFCVIPVAILQSFYDAVKNMLENWLCAGHLVWEVNIWAALEYKETAWFTWWGADHNNTMFEPPGYLT
jgi:hypothetical protein